MDSLSDSDSMIDTSADSMKQPRPTTSDGASRHLVGAALLCIALLGVGGVTALPSRSESTLSLPFLEASASPVVVAFAGYPGCRTACPPHLRTIAEAVDASRLASVQPVFINVERHAREDLTTAWARVFHPRFEGFTLDDEAARRLHRELGVRSYADTRGALAHSNTIFVFHRHRDGWRIARLFVGLPSAETLAGALEPLAT